ncbi:hypothetical protein OC861_006816, partial [Tilletia horrida]
MAAIQSTLARGTITPDEARKQATAVHAEFKKTDSTILNNGLMRLVQAMRAASLPSLISAAPQPSTTALPPNAIAQSQAPALPRQHLNHAHARQAMAFLTHLNTVAPNPAMRTPEQNQQYLVASAMVRAAHVHFLQSQQNQRVNTEKAGEQGTGKAAGESGSGASQLG